MKGRDVRILSLPPCVISFALTFLRTPIIPQITAHMNPGRLILDKLFSSVAKQPKYECYIRLKMKIITKTMDLKVLAY